MFEQILVQTVNGLVNGMVLALVASGLTLIFGIMDVVNFAHGDLVMLGAFTGAVTVTQTGSFWLGLLVASLVIATFGARSKITTLRPLMGPRPLTTIIASLDSLGLQSSAVAVRPTARHPAAIPAVRALTAVPLVSPWAAVIAARYRGSLPSSSSAVRI